MTYRPTRPAHLDVTTVTDWREVAEAFGPRAAWQACIKQWRNKLSRETDPHRIRRAKLMMSNAEVQLALLDE